MANCMICRESHTKASPIHIIARDGSFESLVEIVRYVSDINVRDIPFGGTPLMAAMVMDQHDKVKFLIEKGADVNITNVMGDSPSHIAVMNSFDSSFRLILKHATPNLDAKTMYLGRMTSVHDMIVSSDQKRDLYTPVIRYLLRTNCFIDELFGQYLLPLISKNDYDGIKDVFDTLEDNHMSTMKTLALLTTYCIRPETRSHMTDEIMSGNLETVRFRIVSSQSVYIFPSPIVYEIVVLLHAAESSISRRELREMIDHETKNDHNEDTLRSLDKLSRFANALLTSELDESLPTLHNIAFATMASIDESERIKSLRQRIIQARLTRNWKLLLQK